jgi:carbonic anhydrase/acetyltransferase-like protein (isoleucine patch superfamily)
MENAVLRGTKRHPLSISNNVLIGPHAHLTGCTIAENVFIATKVAIFNGATLGERSVVRIGAIVHFNSRLEPGDSVPIGWIAAGNPTQLQTIRTWTTEIKINEKLPIPNAPGVKGTIIETNQRIAPIANITMPYPRKTLAPR